MKQGPQSMNKTWPQKATDLMFNIEYLINKLFSSTRTLTRSKNPIQTPLLYRKPRSRHESNS